MAFEPKANGEKADQGLSAYRSTQANLARRAQDHRRTDARIDRSTKSSASPNLSKGTALRESKGPTALYQQTLQNRFDDGTGPVLWQAPPEPKPAPQPRQQTRQVQGRQSPAANRPPPNAAAQPRPQLVQLHVSPRLLAAAAYVSGQSSQLPSSPARGSAAGSSRRRDNQSGGSSSNARTSQDGAGGLMSLVRGLFSGKVARGS